MGSLCEREPDAFRFVTPNQSHACEQVATGRWNPYPPPLATIETSELAILSVTPPSKWMGLPSRKRDRMGHCPRNLWQPMRSRLQGIHGVSFWGNGSKVS